MKLQIKEFADFTGVSVRTLHYYDEIGLLSPAYVDEQTGYRFYDENSLLRMQEILFYRELDFPLKSIGEILSSPDYDTSRALKEQKKLLILKKERLERLISAVDDAMKGENVMSAFDNSEFEKYKAEAKEKWGKTDAYKEHAEKTKGYSKEKWNNLIEEMNAVFAEFAACRKNGEGPDSAEVQNLVKKLQNHITENYYHCTNEILAGLGQMYVLDERFKNNIDKHGDGTAELVSEAIKVYCRK
ncbi:MAG: MerR family transcriptional regulator [Lachnospiraceae bacterium]|nr:MerR family transcriptional regulator [Lachnospiraceae bacterium]MBQ8549462.1 MerR family transcriptional regulator [Lachnospiraceae bacterium]MBQ8846816.1 MerR family transcriptional regulator [Lachnospiraceae bacterium]